MIVLLMLQIILDCAERVIFFMFRGLDLSLKSSYLVSFNLPFLTFSIIVFLFNKCGTLSKSEVRNRDGIVSSRLMLEKNDRDVKLGSQDLLLHLAQNLLQALSVLASNWQ